MTSTSCLTCKGSGLVEKIAIICTICNGNGCIRCKKQSGLSQYPWEDCESCSGSGYANNNEQPDPQSNDSSGSFVGPKIPGIPAA